MHLPKTSFVKRLLTLTLLIVSLLAVGVQSSQAVSPNIVISQVYGGGGNSGAPYTNDFVELFNQGTANVDITGWSVQYTSATGTGNFGSNPVTVLNGTVSPGQYYLVQLAGGANGISLPTADATGTANMSASSGKVVVVNQSTGLACNGGSTPCASSDLASIVDLVGYGTANFFEGSGAAPGLSNTTAALRANNGCTDTDDNAGDFVAGPPNPRNTASPFNSCGAPVDNPPTVTSTTPANGDANVAIDANIEISFSEDVTVTDPWFDINCTVGGGQTAVVSGGLQTFTLDPGTDFANDDTCTVTVLAAQVADQDGTADNLSSDYIFSFTTASAASAPTLIITEMMYDPNSPEDNWEWVEIYNAGSTPIDLAGYVIDDNNGVAHGNANITGGSLAAGESGVLYNVDDVSAADFEAAWGMVNLIPVTNWAALSLNNSGDKISLWSDFASYSGDHATHNNAIDTVDYTQAGFVDPVGASIFLTDLSADNNVGANWSASTDGASTPLFKAYTSTAAAGNTGTDIGSPGVPSIQPLLLTELVVTPTGGEFIEIYNPGGTAVDLSNVYVTDATFAGGSTYYYNIVTGTNAGGGGFGDFLARFPDGASIGAGEYQTVALAGSSAFVAAYGIAPTYELFDDGFANGEQLMREALTGSINNQGGLTNDGEVVILFYWDGTSDLVADFDYAVWGDKAEAVDKSGVAVDGPDADSDTSPYLNDTAIVDQDVIDLGAHASGKSWQREDLTEGTEIKSGGNGSAGHDETSEDLSNTFCVGDPTPGAATTCDPETPIVVAKIHEIQGNQTTIAISGLVKVEAVVVADYQGSDQLSGFFLQEEDGDADLNTSTSEGIFVYCGGCADSVSVGDLVEVTGYAEDFFGMSQIDVPQGNGTVTVVSSGNPLPTPATIDLPASSSTKAEGTFENVEGMLVTFADDLFVSEYFELARYGQLVLTADARPHQFTDAYEPSVAGYSAFLDDLNSTRIILDDDNNIQNDALGGTPAEDEPFFWPRPGLSISNLVRGGDSISNLTGVLHWSFAGQSGTDAWRVRPVEEAFSYGFTSNNERPLTPDTVGGSLKVASFNVLNYFTTIDSRGADSVAELDRQRAKTAAAICTIDADIVGLIEIENNGAIALTDLLDGANGINENCGPYAFVDTGVIGGDEIVVAFIYKPATVSLAGDFAVLDSSVDARFIDTLNRPALAQTFYDRYTGGHFTVVVNHLKSKGSACDGDPDTLDGQGNCNGTRTLAAEAMVDWLAADPTNSGDPDYLIIGDLNSYRNEDPIDALEAGPDDITGTVDDYTDLHDALTGPSAYTYVFDGQLGYLDHALANNDLLSQVTGVTAWHINADEIPVFDYNDDIRDPGEASFERESTSLPIYEANAFRASDHDPVVIGLQLEPEGLIVNANGCYVIGIEGTPYPYAHNLITTEHRSLKYFRWGNHNYLFNAVVWAHEEGVPLDSCFEIHGTNKKDMIFAGRGDDEIFGYGRNDMLFGLHGDDVFTGGNGRDAFFGGHGYDTVLDYERGDKCVSIEEGCPHPKGKRKDRHGK